MGATLGNGLKKLTLLIFYLLLAICVSFFCSISEAVLLSVRPSYIGTLEANGKRGAKVLKKLTDNLDQPLAAILTLNTVAHTVGAAGVGAQASVVFGSEYLGVTSAVLTLLILVLSEIIPKTIGATYWQALAPSFGSMINFITRALYPCVWMTKKITRLISRSDASALTFSRDEIEAMAEIGANEGVLETKELKIVQNLMQLNSLSIKDIMTPRPVVFSVPETMTVQNFFSQHAQKPFTRIPIYGRNIDDVTGYVIKTDLFLAQAKDQFDLPLSKFRRDLLMVPAVLSASNCFDRLIHEKHHAALVIDEYGSMRGLVTLEDVLETLIGLEITDELDKVEDMQVLARQRWRQRMEAIGIDPDALEVSSGSPEQ